MLRSIAYMTEFCFENNCCYYFANDKSCAIIKLNIGQIIYNDVEYFMK